MLEQVLNHLSQNKLFNATDRILLAVSGGIDSVVMLHLFGRAGFRRGVCHCNFQLRGEASQGDEDFVKSLCAGQNVPFYGVKFDTALFAHETKQSIQMAARELRYKFFNDILQQHNYQCVATAHHLNDALETILLNLARGSGLDGLTGIPVKQQNRIRPMLFASRSEIESYALANSLVWRDDESNSSDKYARNRLRHQVIPVLQALNPSLEKNISETLERIQGASRMVDEKIQQFKQQFVSVTRGETRIAKDALLNSASPAVLLWELVKGVGFNYAQCKRVTENAPQTGKQFHSNTHDLTVDREVLIISLREQGAVEEILIDDTPGAASNGTMTLTFDIVEKDHFILSKDASVAQLDYDRIQFPLIWRPWQDGDHFRPFGMKQRKKVSDFLIDAKVPLPEKKHVTVLESGGNIIWLVGFRISEDVRIDTQTKRIMVARIEEPRT
jgi:tRNA(Ile)-lysidine synthase